MLGARGAGPGYSSTGLRPRPGRQRGRGRHHSRPERGWPTQSQGRKAPHLPDDQRHGVRRLPGEPGIRHHRLPLYASGVLREAGGYLWGAASASSTAAPSSSRYWPSWGCTSSSSGPGRASPSAPASRHDHVLPHGGGLNRLIAVVFLLAEGFAGVAGVFLGCVPGLPHHGLGDQQGLHSRRHRRAGQPPGRWPASHPGDGGDPSPPTCRALRDVFSFTLLIAFLVWRPNGLMGITARQGLAVDYILSM